MSLQRLRESGFDVKDKGDHVTIDGHRVEKAADGSLQLVLERSARHRTIAQALGMPTPKLPGDNP